MFFWWRKIIKHFSYFNIASSTNSLVFIKVLMKKLDKINFCLDSKLSPCYEYRILFWGDSPASEFYVPTFRTHPAYSSCTTVEVGTGRCSETSAHKIQTPGNHSPERIQQFFSCYLLSISKVYVALLCGWQWRLLSRVLKPNSEVK